MWDNSESKGKPPDKCVSCSSSRLCFCMSKCPRDINSSLTGLYRGREICTEGLGIVLIRGIQYVPPIYEDLSLIPHILILSRKPSIEHMFKNASWNSFFVVTFCFVLGPHPIVLTGYSWFCIQESLLVVLREPLGRQGIEPWSALYKTSALPAVAPAR